MKIDSGYFYDIVPVVDLKHFVELLLVMLADRDISPFQGDKKVTKKARLSLCFKEEIEKAMYSEDALQYLQLIDSYQYYEHQANWEKSLADCLDKYISNKKWKYNFEQDYIEIEFTTDEIENILAQYDEETQHIMENLICHYDIEYCLTYSRYYNLKNKEYRRNSKREYIRNSQYTMSNIWQEK